MSLRAALWIGLFACVVAGLSYRVHRQLEQAFSLPRGLARSIGGILAAGFMFTLGSRALYSTLPELARPLGAVGAAITVGVLITTVLLAPYDALRLLRDRLAPAALRLARAVRLIAQDRDAPPRALEQPELPSRRSFLGQAAVGGAVSLGLGASTYGAALGRTDFTLETVPIRIAKLPRSLDGLSIVQLSDLHVGLYVGQAEFARAWELVERARPDLIVLTGDLLDHDPQHAPALGHFVRGLSARVRRGVFAVPGNHDYYAGVRLVERTLREAGAEVLTNRHVVLGDAGGRLLLGGVDDVVAPEHGGLGPRIDRTFAGTRPELPRVLLSHNPSYFQNAHPHADLTLSGHTHGGQITLFINPAELVLNHGFVRGHYNHRGSQLYVNRGFGTAGPPIRVGSPPEITKLVLTC